MAESDNVHYVNVGLEDDCKRTIDAMLHEMHALRSRIAEIERILASIVAQDTEG